VKEFILKLHGDTNTFQTLLTRNMAAP